MPAPDDRLLATVKETRELLRVGHTTVYSLMANGVLESLTLGRSRRITMRSIEALIARQLAQKDGATLQQRDEGRPVAQARSPAPQAATGNRRIVGRKL